MVEELSIVGSVDTIVRGLNYAYVRLQEISYQLTHDVDQHSVNLDRRDIQLRLGVDLEKLSGWQALWITNNEQPGRAFDNLWGEQGTHKVASLLQILLQDSQELSAAVSQLSHNNPSRAATKTRQWKRPTNLKRLSKFRRTSYQDDLTLSPDNHIRLSINRLSDDIDELWSISEELFRRLHPYLGARPVNRAHSPGLAVDVDTVVGGRSLLVAL